MKLIGNATSPFVRKVTITLHELGVEFQPISDSPWEAESKVAEFNPLGKIPVLITDDGEIIFDSTVIVWHLLSVFDGQCLRPDSLKRKLLGTVANGATEALVLYAWEMKRPPELIDATVLEKYKQRATSGLLAMEEAYRQRPLDIGRPDVSDIAVFCCVEYLQRRAFFSIPDACEHLINAVEALNQRNTIKMAMKAFN